MTQTIKPAPVHKTLTVAASPQKAFEVFTAGVDKWWPRNATIGAAALKTAVMEEKSGGRWYGVDVNGAEDEWGEVLAWEPPARVLLAWRIGADWKYDANLLTEVEARFTDLGDGRTQVDFEHRLLENVGEQAQALREQLNGGWVGILDSFAAVVAGQAPTQTH